MKKTFLFISLFVFVVSFSDSAPKKDEPRLSKREKEKIELIKKVKKFGESLGLNETRNFRDYKEKVSKYNIFFFNEKTKVPYSYVDPAISVVQSPYDNLNDSIKHYEIDKEKYDVYFYVTIGVSSGTYITKRLLSHSETTITQTVLHEDLHDNINLPRHMEEAAALLFGVAGASKYFNDSEGDFRSTMGFALLDALVLDELHEQISSLNKEYLDGKITIRDYLEKRDAKIGNSWYGSMAEVAQHHTYKHYFPLFYRLLKSMNYDLGKFIVFLRDFPFKQPSWEEGHEKYFEKTLSVEVDAELYIESVIKSLSEEKIGSDTMKLSSLFEYFYLLGSFSDKIFLYNFERTSLPDEANYDFIR